MRRAVSLVSSSLLDSASPCRVYICHLPEQSAAKFAVFANLLNEREKVRLSNCKVKSGNDRHLHTYNEKGDRDFKSRNCASNTSPGTHARQINSLEKFAMLLILAAMKIM
jgi:hypothetical protein